MVALASEVSAGFPFEAGEDFLARRFGLDLCYKQVQRLAERTGAVVCEAEYNLASGVISDKLGVRLNEQPNVLTISADGVMVHSDGAWTEMKCASFLSEEHGRSTIATMEKADKFGELVYLEAVRRGLLRAGKVVFVADGAVWIWNMVEHHFPNAWRSWIGITQSSIFGVRRTRSMGRAPRGPRAGSRRTRLALWKME